MNMQSLITLAVLLCVTICFGAPSEPIEPKLKPFRISAQVVTEFNEPGSEKFTRTLNGLAAPIPATSSFASRIYGQVGLGTPASGDQPQQFNLFFDSILPDTFVFDAYNCDQQEWCKSISKFNISASTTYNFVKKPFNYPVKSAGELGSDLLSMGGFSVYQKFGVFNAEAVKDWTLQGDGFLSLVYDSPSAPDWNLTPFVNYLRQIDDKIVTIWIGADGINGTAELMVGAIDSENCKDEWKYSNVILSSKLLKGWWTVPVDAFQIEDAAKVYNNFTGQGHAAIVNTVDNAIIGPKLYVKAIENDVTFHGDLVSCNRTGLPTLKFVIDGNDYTVAPEQYIIDYQPEKDLCQLGLVYWNDKNTPKNADKTDMIDPLTTWSFGHPFLRSYCTALDYSDQKRVGFAQPMSLNSASASTISILAVMLSVLVAFVQKINNF